MKDQWRRVDRSAVAWLAELDPDSVTGFDIERGKPGSLWILNAMYEQMESAGIETHDERHKRMLASGEVEPWRVGDWVETDAPGMRVPGGDLGWVEDPGPGWRRLRWHELAERIGDPVVPMDMKPEYRYPSLQVFPSVKRDGSWPTSIQPPTEGSLDRESFRALVQILRAFSGADTEVFALWCQLIARDFDVFEVYQGLLHDAESLELFDYQGSPANIWPADRSWLVYTDWDLWGTKVSGPPELLAMIEADDFLETIRLPLSSPEPYR
jgi:hypothetical protein